VIFETLNARGEPLLPGDLLRNYVFLKVARAGLPSEELYLKYWQMLDDQFWRVEIRQGRLNRPRSDSFIQSYLSVKAKSDISMKHLFVEYKYWVEKSDPAPFTDIESELKEFHKFASAFKNVIEYENDNELADTYSTFRAMDTNTHLPLFMTILALETPKQVFVEIAKAVESYIIRRTVCGLSQKNYNKLFISLANTFIQKGVTIDVTREFLLQSDNITLHLFGPPTKE